MGVLTSSVGNSRQNTVVTRRAAWREYLFTHRWDVFAVLLGFAMRILMWATFDPRGGYDFPDHWVHLNWYAEHWAFPAKDYTRTAYHAPLYHFLAGRIRALGAGPSGLQLASVLMACARIVFLAVGLNLVLPRSRAARAIALVLAAIMPCSVHLDGMVTQEPLNNLLATVTLVLMLLVFRSPLSSPLASPLSSPFHKRWVWAALAGFAAGLALLTKVSQLALGALLFAAGPLEFALVPAAGLRQRLSRLMPWGLAIVTMCLVGGWWYVRSHVLYGKAFVSGWDLGIDGGLGPQAQVPVLDRRSIGYVTYWSTDVYVDPHYPSGTTPNPRFWPVLVASTFVDYYRYNFAQVGLPYQALLSRISVFAGTVIAAVTASAWLAVVVASWRRRNVPLLVMLAFPMLGVLGQLSFAIQFPYDWEGVVKGIYLQFSTAPLYPVFGAAVAGMTRTRIGRGIAVLCLLSVAAVASYSVYCRCA